MCACTYREHMHACAHMHIACFPPKHSQYANPAWKLERRRRGASFASTGHVPWQLPPDCQPVRWDMCGTLTQWQRSYRSSDLIKKGGACILALSGPLRASFICKQPCRHRVILHYWSLYHCHLGCLLRPFPWNFNWMIGINKVRSGQRICCKIRWEHARVLSVCTSY